MTAVLPNLDTPDESIQDQLDAAVIVAGQGYEPVRRMSTEKLEQFARTCLGCGLGQADCECTRFVPMIRRLA